MGYLNSLWEKIYRPAAEPTANTVVRNHIRQHFITAECVTGAIMYGSGNPESDIDYIVVYEGDREADAKELQGKIEKFAEDHRVPLDGKWVSRPFIESEAGALSLGLSYRLHLERAVRRGAAVKDDILVLMPFYRGDWKERLKLELVSYLKEQITLMEKWQQDHQYGLGESYPQKRSDGKLSEYELEKAEARLKKLRRSDLYQFLSHVLDAPGHIMRKELEISNALQDDSPEVVRELYRKTMSDANWELVAQLISLKEEMRQAAALPRSVENLEIYEQMLRRVERDGTSLLKQFAQRRLAQWE